jgi:hypothetical protein
VSPERAAFWRAREKDTANMRQSKLAETPPKGLQYKGVFSFDVNQAVVLFDGVSGDGEKNPKITYPCIKKFLGIETPGGASQSFAVWKLLAEVEGKGKVVLSKHYVDQAHPLEHQTEIISSTDLDAVLATRGTAGTFVIVDGVKQFITNEEINIPYAYTERTEIRREDDIYDRMWTVREYVRGNGTRFFKDWKNLGLIEARPHAQPVPFRTARRPVRDSRRTLVGEHKGEGWRYDGVISFNVDHAIVAFTKVDEIGDGVFVRRDESSERTYPCIKKLLGFETPGGVPYAFAIWRLSAAVEGAGKVVLDGNYVDRRHRLRYKTRTSSLEDDAALKTKTIVRTVVTVDGAEQSVDIKETSVPYTYTERTAVRVNGHRWTVRDYVRGDGTKFAKDWEDLGLIVARPPARPAPVPQAKSYSVTYHSGPSNEFGRFGQFVFGGGGGCNVY